MNANVQQTFDLLTRTGNPAALAVLTHAMASPHEAIRHGAIEALVKRRAPESHLVILDHLERLSGVTQARVRQHAKELRPVAKTVLTQGQGPQMAACRIMLWSREYSAIPLIILAAETLEGPEAAEVAILARDLVGLLSDDLADGSRSYTQAELQSSKKAAIKALQEATDRFAKHGQLPLVEAFLDVVGPDNAILKRALYEPSHSAYVPLTELLKRSMRPRVMRLLLQFLDETHASLTALRILAHRNDERFLDLLFRKMGAGLSPMAWANLQRLDSLAFIYSGSALLDRLDVTCQTAAIKLVATAKVSAEEKIACAKIVLERGYPPARQAAAEMLREIPGDRVDAMLQALLDDADPEVKAVALSQARIRKFENGLALLTAALQSNEAVLRNAARESLQEFRFDRYFSIYGSLPAESRLPMGQLVKLVDAKLVPQLIVELKSPARTNRLRAIEILEMLELVEPCRQQLVHSLASDAEYLMRAEAARLLGTLDGDEIRKALLQATGDINMSVVNMAQASLELVQERKKRSRPENA